MALLSKQKMACMVEKFEKHLFYVFSMQNFEECGGVNIKGWGPLHLFPFEIANLLDVTFTKRISFWFTCIALELSAPIM